jgi:hypothetical protein
MNMGGINLGGIISLKIPHKLSQSAPWAVTKCLRAKWFLCTKTLSMFILRSFGMFKTK